MYVCMYVCNLHRIVSIIELICYLIRFLFFGEKKKKKETEAMNNWLSKKILSD